MEDPVEKRAIVPVRFADNSHQLRIPSTINST